MDSITSFPTHSQGDPNTTEILREKYATLYLLTAPSFENKLTLEERRIVERSADKIRSHVANEDGAITGAFFRRSPLLRVSQRLDRVLSRILPYQFTAIYSDVFAAVTPTGFPNFSFFEDDQSFPYLDFDIVITMLAKLGMTHMISDHTREGSRRFFEFRAHRNFHEFVRSKDNLLFLLQEHPNRQGLLRNRMDLLVSLRTLPITSIERSETDPIVAAAELYRASEQLCRESPAAQARKQTMTDAQSWRGKYLIMTATDSEDRALRAQFGARGFTAPIVQHAERFSYVEYFRSDIGRVYHVRTSAGSGGASGAFITGKNAIELLQPEYIISVGVCFGLREETQCIGDIIVSDHIHDYEKLRVSSSRFEDRGATREAAPVLLSRARAYLAIWTGASVHVGTVASGEKLVDDVDFREFLRRLNPPPIAGEMEAWGLSAVCHELRKQFIMVKGICDWGKDKTSGHQDIAAANACKFAFDALIVA